jgi:hypothetical protein
MKATKQEQVQALRDATNTINSANRPNVYANWMCLANGSMILSVCKFGNINFFEVKGNAKQRQFTINIAKNYALGC